VNPVRRHAGTKTEGGGDRRRIASLHVGSRPRSNATGRSKALSERYRLGIVSNFYGNLEAVCESAGLCSFFKVMVDSHCVGVEKPDPAIFRVALERLGATPEKAVFIGDSLRRDREGARRMGMRFIWIAPRDVQARQSERQADSAVTDLRDVAEVLQ
jgi:putative hydrolase of the HAD superfamily